MATMDLQHRYRGSRMNGHVEGGGSARRAHHGNKRWVADGGRGRGRSGRFGNASVTFRRNGALDGGATRSEGEHSEMEEEHEFEESDSNEPQTPEEREKFWQELVKARETERKNAIAEGKMDDPLKPKRLEDAITMIGTCMDMCPRFERYRRERENNLFEWETIPGTKRVDHKRAIKAYERAAGDKTLPSDLRPPDVLKRTLDYLFHELLPRGGFSETFNFIRDRSRAVRNDFTMQHETGPVTIACHDRCARFHILALHIERDRPGFSVAMEEQQLMNTLQSLKEFHQDQRGHYQSPTELEMRVYHRLVHIRDQRERHDDIPQNVLNHPVFELTTRFRARVQAKSAPITKTSPLAVDAEAMDIFAELVEVLRREGNVVMTYLIACILERHFGKDTIEDIEAIRGDLSLSDIIDGYSGMGSQQPTQEKSLPDISVLEVPLASSPSVESAPLEDMMGQAPLPQPPLLNRRQPISLPPTPTATVFISPSLPGTRKSIFGSLKNIQTTPLSAAPSEILSPLVLHSPNSRSLSSIAGLSRRESIQSPLKAVVSVADVEAEAGPSTEKLNTSLASKSPPAKKPSLDIMKATALHFARRGWLVKQGFSMWRQQLSDHAKWIEACRRSTQYKEKARAERLSRSAGSRPLPNGSAHRARPSEARAPLKKRLRERLSGEFRPLVNDEELVRRFEKNHEDHARRWARGSFLSVLRDFLESARSPLPDDWCAWLSLNQENDGTAIWLEQKFDVPSSGKWRNESVFQIPIPKDHVESERSHPCVVIFERTPLTGVTDILSRKYRVLEDCTRLREIIEAFPMDRHYVPSLLCIAWSERDPDSSKDFDDMVTSMVEGGILTSTHELLISMAAIDMESVFDKLLHVIPFDLEGQLMKHVSLNDLFDIWEHQWEDTTRWLGSCTINGEFNWDLYAKLLADCTRLLIQIIHSATGLLRDDGVSSDIPHLQLVKGVGSDTTFSTILDWLQAFPETDFTDSLIGDIRAHQDLGRDFPTMTFLSQLYPLARLVAAHLADVHPAVTRFVSRSRLDDASKKIEALKMSFESELNACHFAKLKPPKRLASFTEPDIDSSSSSTPKSKKQRFSLSDGLPTDEETTSLSPPSPSLSIATSVPSESLHTIVTPAMLRSLTKDIRAKYGATQVHVLSASVTR